MNMSSINHQGLLNDLVVTAYRAGGAILKVYGTEFRVDVKKDRTPLTEADTASNRIITDRLKQLTPAIPILSEEGRDISYDIRKNWDLFWLVDPLDGTKEFINRNGEFTVNIALIKDQNPVMGVIYVPVKDLFYFAVKEKGAYKIAFIDLQVEKGHLDKIVKQDLLSISKKLPLENIKQQKNEKKTVSVVASRSHMTDITKKYIDNVEQKFGKVDIVSAGSSLKLCLIAEGNADVYPRLAPTMEWDTAAGQIIVEESGGIVIQSESKEPLIYNKSNLVNPFFICKSVDFIK